MSLIAFINKNTFEIKDELDEYIYCDYEIRNIIAVLNKKGYKTKFSCAGHNEIGLMWPLHRENIDKLEEYLKDAENDETLHFIKKEGDYFYHKDEKTATYVYIYFEDDYKFEVLPSEFTYEIVDNKSYLIKKINYYLEDNHKTRKTDEKIYSELEQSHQDLLNWSNDLPII